MSRRAAVLQVLGLLAGAAIVVRPALAAGVTVTYSITSGTPGSNGWYVSDVTAQIQPSNATDTTCPAIKTFR